MTDLLTKTETRKSEGRELPIHHEKGDAALKSKQDRVYLAGGNGVWRTEGETVWLDPELNGLNIRMVGDRRSKIDRQLAAADENNMVTLGGVPLARETVGKALRCENQLKPYSVVVTDTNGNEYREYYVPVRSPSSQEVVVVKLEKEDYYRLREQFEGRVVQHGERVVSDRSFAKANASEEVTFVDGNKAVPMEVHRGEISVAGPGGRRVGVVAEICTTVGERQVNEDFASVQIVELPDGINVIVARVHDGMGGHGGGDVASGIADNEGTSYLAMLRNEASEVWPGEWESVKNEATRRGIHVGMVVAERMIKAEARGVAGFNRARETDSGTTVTGVIIFPDGNAFVINVGDSRTYVDDWSGFKKQTKDHSLVANLVEAGVITLDEAENHPQRNVIYRTLSTDEKVTVDVVQIKLKAGDRMAIVCDGISGGLADREGEKLNQLLPKGTQIEESAQKLVRAAAPMSGDNDTAIVLQIV